MTQYIAYIPYMLWYMFNHVKHANYSNAIRLPPCQFLGKPESHEGAAASYIILESYVVDTIDENAMNDIFETEDDNVLDFTESNPFGDAGMN